MRVVIWILVFGAFFLFAYTLYLVLLNRGSETIVSKFLTAVCVGSVAIFVATCYSLKSEITDLEFGSTLFLHKSDKGVLDRHYKNVLRFGGAQFDLTVEDFINRRFQQDEVLRKAEFGKDSKAIYEFYHNMLLVKLFSHFFLIHSSDWDVRITPLPMGGSGGFTFGPVDLDSVGDKLKWADILAALDDKDNLKTLLSDFSKDFWIQEMTVPPKTKVDLALAGHHKTLILTNPFVRVSISIDYRGGWNGLGDYRWLLGYDSEKSAEFWSEYFRVNCIAEFEKTRSGHPDMPKYKRWVEVMFTEIQNMFDDEKRLKRARDYRDLTKS